METYHVSQAHPQSKMLPATSYTSHFLSHPYRLKIDFTPLFTKVQTSLLCRLCTRVFLRQSMGYDLLLQALPKGGDQEQLTAKSFVAGPAWVAMCLECRDWGQLLLLVYLGDGLDLHPSTTHVLRCMQCLRPCMKPTVHSSTSH